MTFAVRSKRTANSRFPVVALCLVLFTIIFATITNILLIILKHKEHEQLRFK
jgi:hypothetical protein